jgi:hypothetical protein
MLSSDQYKDNEFINSSVRKIISYFGLKKRIKTFPINLKDHWLKPIYSSWLLLLFVALMRFFFELTQTIIPFFVGQLFIQQNISSGKMTFSKIFISIIHSFIPTDQFNHSPF